MRLNDLVGGIEGMESGVDFTGVADIKGLSADSREIEPGFVFVAIPGTRTDGAEFIPAALENGAAAIVVAPDVGALPDVNVPVLTAQNPRAALAHMAAQLVLQSRRGRDAHEYPREIAFIDELPLTTTGKVIRRLLRDEA